MRSSGIKTLKIEKWNEGNRWRSNCRRWLAIGRAREPVLAPGSKGAQNPSLPLHQFPPSLSRILPLRACFPCSPSKMGFLCGKNKDLKNLSSNHKDTARLSFSSWLKFFGQWFKKMRKNESVSTIPDFLIEDKPLLYTFASSAPPPRCPPSVKRWGVKALLPCWRENSLRNCEIHLSLHSHIQFYFLQLHQ